MLLELPDDFIPHDFIDELEREKLIKIYGRNLPKKFKDNVILHGDVETVLYELIHRYKVK